MNQKLKKYKNGIVNKKNSNTHCMKTNSDTKFFTWPEVSLVRDNNDYGRNFRPESLDIHDTTIRSAHSGPSVANLTFPKNSAK